ncbi:YeeE/YedE family protein, partial [filamentous cyanobacterium CCP4]
MAQNLVALVAGLLFGLGLGFSQMIDPQRVIGFLDVFG